ncbi:MAG: lysophospholipid acyltransferase family protein [Candidatus Omnitrophica bacterium]|nr:lysophospholipid acyltransferase family protein [Candidatus Omnitrophota bacterium]
MWWLLYHFFAFLVLHFPKRASLSLAHFAALYRYWTTPVLKRHLRENISQVLKETGRSQAELEGLVREGYFNFGRYLHELYFIPKIDRNFLKLHLEIRGRENLDQAFQQGRGVISLTAHLGNWELAGIFTALLGYPITAVALPHPGSMMNHFFIQRRKVKGVKVVVLGKQTKRIITALRQNELVALLGDRAFGPPYLSLKFFGKTALLPAGPAQLAVKLGSPIVPGFLVRENDKYILFFEPPIYPDFNKNGLDAVNDLAKRGVVYLEKYISAYLSQWLVFDDIWKK